MEPRSVRPNEVFENLACRICPEEQRIGQGRSVREKGVRANDPIKTKEMKGAFSLNNLLASTVRPPEFREQMRNKKKHTHIFPNLRLARHRLSGAQGTKLSNIFRSTTGPHPQVPNRGRLYCMFPNVLKRRASQPLHEATPTTAPGPLSLTHLVLTVGLEILDTHTHTL